MSEWERWVGCTTGKISAVRPMGHQWEICIKGEWYKTKGRCPVNDLISGHLIGQTVSVWYENVKNPRDRRVHHIETEMYPTFPGMEQGS